MDGEWGEDLVRLLEDNEVKDPLDLTNVLRQESIEHWHPAERSERGLQATLERSSFHKPDSKTIGTEFEVYVSDRYGANKVDRGERDEEIGVSSRLAGWPVQVKSCCYGVKRGDEPRYGSFKLRSNEDNLGEKSLMVFLVYQPLTDAGDATAEVLEIDYEHGGSFSIEVLGELAVPTPIFHDSVDFEWWSNGHYEMDWPTVFGEDPMTSPVYDTLLAHQRSDGNQEIIAY